MEVIRASGNKPLMNGTTAPVNMGISDDPEDQLMILNVLSKSIYTDKIGAVLREYACNAYDANVEAGRGDTPIEVRLPNRLDQSFAVRDFGYGMTEDEVLNVFCRLGKSSKRKDRTNRDGTVIKANSLIGTLGIGSKAGFAYGDSFLVTSYCDGVKSVYNCFRDQGVPRLAKMHSGRTEAPDGVEVKVPVKLHDVEEFVRKAERVYRYFKLRPIIQGAQIAWENHPAEFSGTGWRYTGSGKSFAIMGNVGYDMSEDGVGDRVGARMQTLINLGVELDFNIGEVEMSASREGLEYTDYTKHAIGKRLDIVAAEITKVFCDRIEKAPTLWDAYRMYADNFEKLGRSQHGMRTLKEVVNQGLFWKGQQITTGRFHVGNTEKIPGVRVNQYTKSVYHRAKIGKEENPEFIYASTKTQLCINDHPNGINSPSRIKGFFEHNVTGTERLVIFTFENSIAQRKYWAARQLDGAPTIVLSSITPSTTMTAAGNSVSEHRSKHAARGFQLVTTSPPSQARSRNPAKSLWWNNVAVNLRKDAGVYVRISEFHPLNPGPHGQQLDPAGFLDDVQEFRKCGLLDDQPVYGFKHSAWEQLDKYPQWMPLHKYLIKRFEDEVIKRGFLQEFANYKAARNYSDLLEDRHKDAFGVSQLGAFLKAVHRMRHPKGPVAMMEFVQRGDASEWIPVPKLPAPSLDLHAEEAKVKASYPMLAHIDRSNLCFAKPAFITALAQYVKLVGK